MVAVPWLTPVARPAALMVAIAVLLELHATSFDKSSVAPAAVAPMAMN